MPSCVSCLGRTDTAGSATGVSASCCRCEAPRGSDPQKVHSGAVCGQQGQLPLCSLQPGAGPLSLCHFVTLSLCVGGEQVCCPQQGSGSVRVRVRIVFPINCLCPFWTLRRGSGGCRVTAPGVWMAVTGWAGLGTDCRCCTGFAPHTQGCVSALCPRECLILQSGAASAGEAGRATVPTVLGSWLGHSAPRELSSLSCTEEKWE